MTKNRLIEPPPRQADLKYRIEHLSLDLENVPLNEPGDPMKKRPLATLLSWMPGIIWCLVEMGDISHGQVFYLPDEGQIPDALSPEEDDSLFNEKAYDYGKAPYFDEVLPNQYPYKKDLALSDEKVKERIERRLEKSLFLDGEGIRVQVKEGTAVLSGYVENRSDVGQAIKIAYQSGAEKVLNGLRLLEREQPWKEMTDRQLKEAVEHELFWSPFVNADPIRVEVRNGVVTLSGRSENRKEMANAIKNAYDAGARYVRNKLWIDSSLN